MSVESELADARARVAILESRVVALEKANRNLQWSVFAAGFLALGLFFIGVNR